jgi:hypothetical protein
MGQRRDAHIILFGKYPGRRWECNTKMALRETVCEDGKWRDKQC